LFLDDQSGFADSGVMKKKLQIRCPAHAPLPDMNTVNQLRTISKNTQFKVAAELSRTAQRTCRNRRTN
jgi:hypothetical protein